MWHEMGLTWADALRVVVSTVGLYLLMLTLIRVMGQRTMARLSNFDLAAAVALGAVIGRAILGYTPTLVAGALGVITLLVLQAVTGQLRRFPKGLNAVSNRAYVLMAGERIVMANLRRTHVAEHEITARLRLAGIRSWSEVACVILELTGEISVLRRGMPIERGMLEDVVGAELVPAAFLADPEN
ncbi:DUF421 domain-containing protein [Arthrobacter echini]|uniref:DUF421 domain-containing protein n=2 Tax=Arthrobacter echini TaxID=1529066 RepID=A0A5D0XS90_9MICC|nr:DUF421 domain-containing protein [Arthrobacter echini]